MKEAQRAQKERLNTPVLLLVFNRPESTKQVFNVIRKVKPLRLYIGADAARESCEGEREKVSQVRRIVSYVDWECEVRTLFHEENLGCKYAVSRGISWFFENEQQGIILEDDCLPNESFFFFCSELLDRFAYNERIMAICGTNIYQDFSSEESYIFSKYSLMWGWASWRRAWKHHDLELTKWPDKKKLAHLRSIGLDKITSRIVWRSLLDRTSRGEINTWDYQWIYTCWEKSGLTIIPSRNLVKNIGFNSEATHTSNPDPVKANLPMYSIDFPLTHPQKIFPDENFDLFVGKHWFAETWISILKNALLRIYIIRVLNKLRKTISTKGN